MMTYQPEEKSRLKRQREEQAINLAMLGKWTEAMALNQSILELFPGDVDSYNRLGKALTELGRYREARAAYGRALELDPGNTIARKNLSRLNALKETPSVAKATPAAKADPRLFIEERGKTAVVALQQPAPRETIARSHAGDQVALRVRGRSLVAESLRGEYLGMVEPKLALRLIRLIEGGNRYAAAITSVDDTTARVIIREVFQAPALAGTPSFPVTAETSFRPYTRETLLRYGFEEEEEELEEGRYAEEGPETWEGERSRSWHSEVEAPENDHIQPLPEEDEDEEVEE